MDMKIPACEKLGKVKGFWNKYSALTILTLVFLSSTAQAQLDTVHPRSAILANPAGNRYLFLESAYGVKAGIDTSTRLAIKDTNTMVIFRGTAFVWTKKSNVLRWDTLKTNTGSAFDSTDVKFTTFLSNNYLNSYDPTYFTESGGILGLNVGALPSGGTANLNYISIADTGATVGSADNHTAILAAATAAAAQGKALYIPPGTWISSSLTFPAGLTIFGQDSTSRLKQKSGAGSFVAFINLGDGSTLKNLTVDGNPVNSAVPGCSNILVQNKKNVTVSNVISVNAPTHGINFNGSTAFNISNIIIDSAGEYGIQVYNSTFGKLQDVTIRGWGKLINTKTAVAVTCDVVDGTKNIDIERLTTYNKFNSNNFSVESPGSVYQTKFINITNGWFYTHVFGGAGVSMSIDTSTIVGNHFVYDSVYFGTEISGRGNLVERNYFVNATAKSGTNLSDSSVGTKIINNDFRTTGSDATSFDGFIGIGGRTHTGATTGASYIGYEISGNTFDSRNGNPGVDIFIGYQGGGRGTVKNFKVNNNTSYGKSALYLLQFTGTDGSGNDAVGNKIYGGGTLFTRDNGAYTATTFKDNLAPAGTILGTGINTTNFPNYLSLNNRSDTTLPSQLIVGTTTITPFSGTPEGNLSAPVGSQVNDITTGNIYTKTSGTGNTGWAIVSGGGAVTLGNTLLQQLLQLPQSGGTATVIPAATATNAGVMAAADKVALDSKPTVFNVKTYGAKGDGVEHYVASMTSGSPTLTCSDCSFTSGDVGKVVVVDTAGGSGTPLRTTISGYTNSTTVTLAANAGATVSAKRVVYGTDDTSPIQSAINACAVLGGTVWFPNSLYIINGALQTSVAGVNPNSQLYIPAPLNSRTNPRPAISLEGESEPSWIGNDIVNNVTYYPTKTGCVLLSTINGSGTAASVIGTKAPASAYNNFNYASIKMSNLTILTQINPSGNGPTVGGINMTYATNFNRTNVKVEVDGIIFNEPTPTADVAGIITPMILDETMSFGQHNLVLGYRYGIVHGEHDESTQEQVNACYFGHVFSKNNAATHGNRLESQWCAWDILIPSTTILGNTPDSVYFSIDQFETEDLTTYITGKWYNNQGTVHDSLNLGVGSFLYSLSVSGNAYANGTYSTIGASQISARNIRNPSSGSGGVGGSQALYDVLAVGQADSTHGLYLPGYRTAGPHMQIGPSMFLQGYDANNNFIGYNVRVVSGAYAASVTGSTGRLQFTASGGLWYNGSGSTTAGAAPTTHPGLYVAGNGQAAIGLGAGLTVPLSWTDFAPSTTAFASVNIPAGAVPTTPNDGDIWQNSNHLYARLTGVTYQLDQQGGGGSASAPLDLGSYITTNYGLRQGDFIIHSHDSANTFIGYNNRIVSGSQTAIRNGSASFMRFTQPGGLWFRGAGPTIAGNVPVWVSGLYVAPNGQSAIGNGAGDATPSSWVDVPAATTSFASLHIPAGTQPTSPSAGNMYFDGTHLYFRIGSTWYQLDQQSGGGGGGTPGGSNTQLQYNNSGAFGGAANLTYDNASGNTTITGTGNSMVDFYGSGSAGNGFTVHSTNPAAQSNFYINDENNNYSGYAGFIYGNTGSTLGNIFGVSRANKLNLFADGASNSGMNIGTLGNTSVVIGTNNTPQVTVAGSGYTTFAGTTYLQAIEGPSFSLTHVTGTGAGTSGFTTGQTGNDMAMRITVNTGTGTAGSASIMQISFQHTFTAAPTIILTPANAAAAALTGTQQVYVDQGNVTTTGFDIRSGSTALATSTTYKWNVHIIQ
jgi:hypothetical protein